MSKSLIRKNQLHPDIADLISGYGSQFFIGNSQAVFVTGNQTIGGYKVFTNRTIISGELSLYGGLTVYGGVAMNNNLTIAGYTTLAGYTQSNPLSFILGRAASSDFLIYEPLTGFLEKNNLNIRSWVTGLTLSNSTNLYQIPFSGGNYPRPPTVFAELEITGTTVFNYNIRNRSFSGFGIYFSNPILQNVNVNVMTIL